MPKLKHPDQHGDLYAQVEVKIPGELTDEEKSLFKELAALRQK
jgi:curved DNA-binding protein